VPAATKTANQPSPKRTSVCICICLKSSGRDRWRFTASSQAFLSSVTFAVLTLITSRYCDETTERGPTGRSDSGEDGGFKRVPLGLGVRVGLWLLDIAVEPSVSDW